MTDTLPTGAPPGRWGRRWPTSFKVWCLVVAISAGALSAILVSHLFTRHGLTSGLVPWWALTIGMAAAELLQVHLTIRRHSWSATLTEIPLVIGLTMSGPRDVVIAQLSGCLIARGVVHRQSLQKLAFNVASCALEATAAIVVFGALADGRHVQDPRVWLAAYLAVLAEGTVSSLGISAVMAIVTGEFPRDVLTNFALGAVVVPIGGTALALQTSIMIQSEQDAVVLLAFTVGLLVIGYRAYALLRARYANLDLLYRFTEAVKESPEEHGHVETLLRASSQVMHAESAELVMSDGAGQYRRQIVGDPVEVWSTEAPSSWATITTCPSGLLAPRGTKDRMALKWLASGPWDDGMVVPLRRHGATVGTLAVANREGDVATFDKDHFRLFETLANHAAVSLEKTELIERLTFEATHDALTELVNRQQFHRLLGRELELRPAGRKIAVALIDLDRFKEINDTLGHHTGDELLAWLGRRMATIIGPNSLAARLGGDEFAIFVTYEGSKDDAVTVIREMLDPLWSEAFTVGQAHVDVDVDASVGVSVAPDDAEDASILLQRADVAMYAAKREGGTGNVAPYRSERDTNSAQKLALASELRSAISAGSLDVHFQPQVDLKTGAITSAEALVRWSHPTRGPLPPDDFIPLAERTGLIVPLTYLVLDKALAACSAWHRAGVELSVAVNVSVRSLGDAKIVETVEHLLEQHALAPSWLTIEVTESGVMEDERRNVGVLEALAQVGVRVAVDDFGTGYSSLAYLKRLPVDEVKIDKSFVMAMQENAEDAAIVRSVIELARNLRLSVVAEGVETGAAMETLARLGCTTAQGYHIGRAVPADALLDLTRQWNAAYHAPAPAVLSSTLPTDRLGVRHLTSWPAAATGA